MTTAPTPRSPEGLLGPARRMIREAAGGTSIEYALVASLIAVAIVGALGDLGAALISLPLPALIDAFQSVLS